MDFLHTRIKIVSRNKGKSAVAAAAYRSGTKIENLWDGVTHDYTRKQHIIHSEIMLPPNAPKAYLDRATLWNSVEWFETDRNAQLAREFEFSLPVELTHEQQLQLVRGFVRKNFVDEGMCADFSIHDKRDGNPHVHILLTVRPLNEDGTWGQKSRLVYDLDENGRRIPAKQKGRWKNHKESLNSWDDRGNGKKWREAAAAAINDALREAGFEQGFVDPRTYAEQGVERIPMIHEGPTVRAMERKGIRTDVGDQNRDIRNWNKQADQVEARLNKATAWARYQANEEHILAEQGKEVADANLRYRLANAIFSSPAPTGRKDRRVQDGCAVLSIMKDYSIVDGASYLAAMKQINDKFYTLRSEAAETDRMLDDVGQLINAAQCRKQNRHLYEQYQNLPPKKQADFYEQHRPELAQYERAVKLLAPLEESGWKWTLRQLKDAYRQLEKQRFSQEH